MGTVPDPEPLKVLIIGAGSAGLLMGQVLKKAGIPATIFEQDASPTARQRDWDFGIYWAQSRIAECLTPELNALIDTVQTDPSYRHHAGSTMPIHNGATGELLKELPAPHAIRLRRRAWLDLIRTGLDVRYSKKLATITTTPTSVTATFTDNTTATGTLLIGCEGAHSLTRTWLFHDTPHPSDADLQHLPVSTFATLTRYPRDTALALRAVHPTYSILLDTRDRFGWYSLHNKPSPNPEEWVFLIIFTWNYREADDHERLERDGEYLLAEMRRNVGDGLAYPYDAMLRDIPEGTKVWYSRQMACWPTKRWDGRGGRVTLAGDAAHAVSFHRGQGLGNAITDVAEFQGHLRAMKEQTPEELARAVAKYEEEVWKRGHEVVMENKTNTLFLHDWEKVLQSPLFTTGVGRAESKGQGAQ
ncbi:uncharacterized protein C8A04DRAFT_31422 [Dichotomopilus funicola]|uniref:FAD-binding domain-containing protein n=1 Tax=Dichotomopilus funicola TaxID=1934379 RepID=A0AAN6UXG6_9PEZI|nr:hypothetical protein C8A04DRAFT_31422 [Dichotomopilus funicola]